MKKITILGIACVDLIVSGYKKIPALGKLEFTDEFKLNTGGCALNCAIDLKKIGIEHQLFVPIGKDMFGDFIKNSLQKNEIPSSSLIELSNAPTSTSVVLSDPSGERSFLHNPGANAKLCISDLDLDQLLDTDILFIGGALLMPSFDGTQMAEVLRKAKNKDVYTVLDIGWDASGKWMETLEPVLKYIDLFVPSIDEAEKLTGHTDIEKINKLLLFNGVKEVIIKLGDRGAVYFPDNQPKIVPSVFLEKIVDSTGAGDSFMSGILTGLYYEWTLEKTIQFANVVGSMCVMDFGASQGIKSYKEILTKRDQYYGK